MNVVVALSTVADGNMIIHSDKTNAEVIENRTAFLAHNSVPIERSTRLNVTYDGNDYTRYVEVTQDNFKEGMYGSGPLDADALITRVPNHGLFLPLADCIGAVLFDPEHSVLMVSHLGRHSVEQYGGIKSVQYLASTYASDPKKIKVWLTPAPGQDVYPLFAFDNRSFKEVAIEQLIRAGILPENIVDNPAETDKDLRYFSHSEYLAGRRENDGRHAIVAMMTS